MTDCLSSRRVFPHAMSWRQPALSHPQYHYQQQQQQIQQHHEHIPRSPTPSSDASSAPLNTPDSSPQSATLPLAHQYPHYYHHSYHNSNHHYNYPHHSYPHPQCNYNYYPSHYPQQQQPQPQQQQQHLEYSQEKQSETYSSSSVETSPVLQSRLSLPDPHNHLHHTIARSPSADRLRKRTATTPARRSNRSSPSHVCVYCGKGFPRPSALRQHVYSHTGEKPFTCEVCNRSFSVKTNLIRHQRKVHSKLLFSSPTTPKSPKMKLEDEYSSNNRYAISSASTSPVIPASIPSTYVSPLMHVASAPESVTHYYSRRQESPESSTVATSQQQQSCALGFTPHYYHSHQQHQQQQQQQQHPSYSHTRIENNDNIMRQFLSDPSMPLAL